MPNFRLKRFSDPGVLKAMAPESLQRLLSPHARYLSDRGLDLPTTGAGSALDCAALAKILISPDETTPPQLASAFFFIHSMATVEGMDALLSSEPPSPALASLTAEMTPADVALHFYLLDRERLEEKHAETVYLVRPRAFECLQTRAFPPPEFAVPSGKKVRNLEKSLAARFSAKRRGGHCRVSFHEEGTRVRILVHHGRPFKREGTVEGRKPSSVFFRPEAWDVLDYDRETGELGMHAGSKGERELYRKAFGLFVFGDEDAFVLCNRYTLEPLREMGRPSLVCSDIEGLEQVVLREVCISLSGAIGGRHAISSGDVFAVLESSNPELRDQPIVRAKFQVKFSGSRRPRTVTIQPNRSEYIRDEDRLLVEEWLKARGFVVRRRAVALAA